MDLEKLDLDKILEAVIQLLRAIGGGWATVAATILSIFGISAVIWYLRFLKKKAAEDETARKRREAQAGNPGDNAEAERDAKDAADEIEEIIDDQGRR